MLTKKNNYTVRWFRSILLILLPCFLLCSLLCFYMLHISENNMMEMNTTIAGHVQKNMDNRLEELYRYALTIEISSPNTALKNLKDSPEPLPKQAYQIADTLKDYLITNTYIRNAYIFYPNIDLVVGNIGCFSSNAYYTLLGYPDNNGYHNWLETLKNTTEVQIKELTFQQEQRFCYIHAMKTENATTSIMVFEIDYQRLLQDFEPEDSSNVITIGLLADNHLVASVGNPQSLKDIDVLYGAWEKQSDAVVTLHDIYGFFYPSTLFDLTYVTIYAASQLRSQIYFPLFLTFGGALLCLLVGIVGAFFISIRNGRPMESILTALGKKPTSVNEDYQFILQKFEQMTEEKYKSEEFMQNHQTLLNSIFLSSLLRDNLQNENVIFSEAKRYEVSFEAPIYQIIILACPQYKVPDFSSDTIHLSGILSSFRYSGLITAYRHHFVILLNTDEPIPEHEIHKIVEDMRTFAFKDYPSQAAIGTYCDNMSGIVLSYRNALSALHGIKSTSEDSIVRYSSSDAYMGRGNPDLMKMFSTFIYTNQFRQAGELLDQLETEYLYPEDSQTGYLRLNALTNLLADAAYSVLPQQQASKEVSDLLQNVSQKYFYLKQIDVLLEHLQDFQASHNESKTPIAAQARQYIEQNYTDPMMGLYLVSDHLGVSNSYLSASFKKAYDINVIQYINQLRIELAKDLILNTKKNIKEIAQDVGFSSDINFIRVFKKMENQTPSMLRKKNSTD